MKLLTKTNLFYTFFALIIFIIGGFAFFFIIQNEIYEEIDEALVSRKDVILKQAAIKGEGYFNELTKWDDIRIIKANQKAGETGFEFSDTLIFRPGEREGEQFRRLTFNADLGGTIYKIDILRSATDSDSLIDGIALSASIIFLLLLGGGTILNYFISKRIWKPFYRVLNIIKDYRPGGKPVEELPYSSISEFSKLNQVIDRLVTKVESDFINLKQFTENASHEIQTPLAIIKAKSELLLQMEELDKEVVKEIVGINEAATRLSKLNQALLLLMKIDNRQYQESDVIDLSVLLEKKLQRLNELVEMKNIKLQKNINKNVFICMNISLAEILLSNLLNNSIKHNVFGGDLIVNLVPNELTIKNTGEMLNIEPEKLFDRFVKESTSNESIGLGLSLVKQICETYNFGISYNYEDSMHELKFIF
ncbi:MAG: HAMP domain-containing sensor histidine kinase [Ignavibacteriaceae bacterium]|nr:HAMP domain-containing sensor histidine kinase [Ignavibacteriaceae bacterium]